MENILILDKSRKELSKLHGVLLRENNYNLVCVSTLDEFLDILKKENIFCCILRYSDIAILKKIQAISPLQRILVCVENIEQGFLSTVDGKYLYIREPYSTLELIEIFKLYNKTYLDYLKRLIDNHFVFMYESFLDDTTQNILDKSLEFVSRFFNVKEAVISIFDKDKNDFILNSFFGITKNNAEKFNLYLKEHYGLEKDNNKICIGNRQIENMNLNYMANMLLDEEKLLGMIGLSDNRTRYFNFVDHEIFAYYSSKLINFIKNKSNLLELRCDRDRLSSSNKEMEEFVYSAFHDLKTPLFTLQGFLDSFKDYACDKLDDHAMVYINGITHGAARLEGMIKDTFEYFKYTKLEYMKTSINSDELLRLALDQLQLEIQKYKVKIVKQKGKWPIVYGDKYKLVRVWVNLIENAMKYRRDKVVPEIELGFLNKEKDMVTFYIKDNGIGIDKRFFDYIFKMFSRTREKDDVDGTGIGLPVIKKIVEKHGGVIWLESEKNKGSIFYFTLSKKDV